jgi:chemotaxis protein histidine kinase CheA
MAKLKHVEMFSAPNTLKNKIGGGAPALDQHAIEKAEAALAGLSHKFDAWITEELARLTDAWTDYEAKPGTTETRGELHRRSHDLKGLAPTYGYPLVGRVCSSLCKLTGDEHDAVAVPEPLLRAHVDAVKAMVNGRIKGAEQPVGLALATELEARTKTVLASVGKN